MVVFALLIAGQRLHAQQPDVWPQDDTYDDSADGGQQAQYNSQSQQQYPQQSYNTPQQVYPQPNYVPQQGYQQQGYPQQTYSSPSYGEQTDNQPAYGQPQGMNAEQLEQLVAPIALYPDALLAQVLAASTYPAQVAAADQWLRSMGNAPPEQIAAGANAQSAWDPSVKALTAFPQVLANMDQNLQWTTALGNAYYNQPQDLMQTVQVLRQRAQSAGNLQSTPQEQITDNQGYIGLAPADPQVVYVPTYNPWAVYGQPVAPYPYYSPVDSVGAVIGTAVEYGLGFAMSSFINTPFSLFNWGLDWFGNSILFNHSAYCSRSSSVADWGFEHGGPRAFRGGEYGRYGGDRYGHQWNAFRNEQGFNRGGDRFPSARPAQRYGNRPGGEFNRGSNFPVARPGQGNGNRLGGEFNRGSNFPIARPGDGRNQGSFNRGYQGFGNPRPSDPRQFASNRMPEAIARPQPYQNRPQAFAHPQQFSNYGQRNSYGLNSFQRPAQPYGGGRSPSYSVPSQSFRAPASGFSHRGFGQPGNSFAGNYGQSGHSGGGFHLFGGGHNNSPSYGGGHSFGGNGHSFGGGGSHSFSGGGHSFGGGGGHSFGGGGHSFGGGGHSGGGHSSGGHSGGHHSR